MEKRFIRFLTDRFKEFTGTEILQHVLFAEMSMENERLAFRRAVWDLMSERRKLERFRKKFQSFSEFHVEEPAFASDSDFRRYLDEEEWHSILKSLPLPARMLAHIAKTECAAFAEDPGWVMSRKQREILLGQIKRRFLAWHDRHSEAAFLKARSQLTSALRRNRRDGKNGAGGKIRHKEIW